MINQIKQSLDDGINILNDIKMVTLKLVNYSKCVLFILELGCFLLLDFV